jgi:hypothetical protein
MSNSNNDLRGGGPWTVDVPALDPGESFTYDYRNERFNGQKGFFRQWIPFDSAQIVNQSPETLRVTFNGVFDDVVVPNAVESYDEIAITRVRVENTGSSATTGDAISIITQTEPYGADEKARDNAQRGMVSQVIENFTGIKL